MEPDQSYIGSRLIIVEGLTGSGKSILAHFIARQLAYHGLPARWVHEAEMPHPVLLEDDIPAIEDYMAQMLARWSTFVERISSGGEIVVVEACLFNNLLETLLAQMVNKQEILQYAGKLQKLIEPLEPVLVYLVQADVENSLVRNFENRGEGFKEFVIRLVEDMPLAQHRGWQGYEGMLAFWKEDVALMDEIFGRFQIHKVMVDNSTGDWDAGSRQVLEFLGLPWKLERGISPAEAQPLVGVYKDRKSGREFRVAYQDGMLTANLFLNVQTRLVRKSAIDFLAEGWHFELNFETNVWGDANLLKIGGRDVDYLKLVGTVAEKI